VAWTTDRLCSDKQKGAAQAAPFSGLVPKCTKSREGELASRRFNLEDFMQERLSRFVDKAESRRLGVESGWYGTKVSGTFVTGPHPTQVECEHTMAKAPTVPNATATNEARRTVL
jgi:hypothetical protein